MAVFGFAEDADAHDGVILTLHGDGHGSVWLTVLWQDGHPVTEPVGMTMLATSDAGQRVGPVPLRRNGDALTYSGTLAPGDWTVVAEMGTPRSAAARASCTSPPRPLRPLRPRRPAPRRRRRPRRVGRRLPPAAPWSGRGTPSPPSP
ncbi:hypothetical protein [Dactylosporangium darangshiense]|uniref:hypothetical protein n=1 Tax=Dactylosporangium darangshiense TaxID=579108 RepID=UPI00363DE60C